MAILITIIGFGIMVLLHELGHFLVAKKFGVLVHEFSIGMGPKIYSFGKGETMYSLRALPIGGFVRLEGEGETEETDNLRSFANLAPIKRIAILIAGAAMNILLGWLIFTIININFGVSTGTITQIADEYKQQTVLQAGDTILKMDNKTIHNFDDVAAFMRDADGSDIDIVVKRNGEKKSVTVTPFNVGESYKLGAVFSLEKTGILKSAEYAVYDSINIANAVIDAVVDLVRGKQSLDTLSGPVEIVSVVGDVTKNHNQYTFINILILFAMITVNLGIFNLLPFPALDGGSIVFALYELITRKKVKQEIVGYVSFIGFALLMLLAVYVTIGDIKSLIK